MKRFVPATSPAGLHGSPSLVNDRVECPVALQPNAQVLVVILNFNGIDDTLACLSSLYGQTCKEASVLVVDNGSKNDDLGRIASAFPEAMIVALSENLGWAGGNNIGMRQALDQGYGYVCLLNNDTILDPTAIEELLLAAAALGQPCLLHPTIAYFDDPAKWQLNPQPRPVPAGSASNDQLIDGIVEMDWAYGACLLMPVSVLENVGVLDERFFLQLEESDYFLRAKARNIRSFCALRARILHKESSSFGSRITDTKTYYQVRNSFLLAEKHTPTLRGFLSAARSLIWALRNQARDTGVKINGWLGFLKWILSNDLIARAARQGLRDYIYRHFGRRPVARPAS